MNSKLCFALKLRMKIGNMSKRQQPDLRADICLYLTRIFTFLKSTSMHCSAKFGSDWPSRCKGKEENVVSDRVQGLSKCHVISYNRQLYLAYSCQNSIQNQI